MKLKLKLESKLKLKSVKSTEATKRAQTQTKQANSRVLWSLAGGGRGLITRQLRGEMGQTGEQIVLSKRFSEHSSLG